MTKPAFAAATPATAAPSLSSESASLAQQLTDAYRAVRDET
ncbi:MAG: hypothetical protein V7632_4397, partial [Bradyrhizobium sp.]